MWYRIDRYTDHTLNPETGFPYDDSWVVFAAGDEDYRMRLEGGDGRPYVIRAGKHHLYPQMALGDFLDYHETAGHKTLLALSEEALEEALKAYEGHSCRDRFLREYENPVMVHSTTSENFERIRKDGCLKCWNRLKKEGALSEKEPIGRLLGDPLELREYICFGSGATGEIVVSSKEKQRIEMDWNQRYRPGARLYFDIKRIAEDGLLIRDGSEMKVKDALPLRPYLIWAATASQLDLEPGAVTPRQFAENADRCFKAHFRPDFRYEAYPEE